MIKSRPLEEKDFAGIKHAIDRDTFHPGLWSVDDFKQPGIVNEVYEDEKGPVVYVQFTGEPGRLRFATVWVNSEDTQRNAHVIIVGVRNLVHRCRACGIHEIVFATKHERLANFMMKVLGFKHLSGEDYILHVKE